ncbi:hypothetical protein R3W88_022798 [Solanum pinnatisectum]|uniref:Polyprotein protein n=1 Tax=Solanum pinnatisectum TaxID=50273 RepID=A0AAV9LYP3_9SOLN|nr:hypothetical protein R3W88_022798 [Solanum pinnatisectum]
MVHLAQSADVRASRVEVVMHGLIKWTIDAALGPIRAKMREHIEMIEVHKLALDALTVRVEDCEKDIPAFSDVPLPTTGDEMRADEADAEIEAETDEEQLGEREETVYEELAVLEAAMFEIARQASLQVTSMLGSSGAKDLEIPGTDAQT